MTILLPPRLREGWFVAMDWEVRLRQTIRDGDDARQNAGLATRAIRERQSTAERTALSIQLCATLSRSQENRSGFPRADLGRDWPSFAPNPHEMERHATRSSPFAPFPHQHTNGDRESDAPQFRLGDGE